MQTSNIHYFFGLVLLGVLTHNSEACMKKFKRAADMEKVSKECFKKSGFREVPSLEAMSKPDFDDKCAAKCILGALDMIDDEGQVDTDAFVDFLEEDAPKPLLLKLTESVASCSEKTEKIKGTKKGETPPECKVIRNFYRCFATSAEKLC